MSAKDKEILIDELEKKIKKTIEETPSNPFRELDMYNCSITDIMAAEVAAEIDDEILKDITNSISDFTRISERDSKFANKIIPSYTETSFDIDKMKELQ